MRCSNERVLNFKSSSHDCLLICILHTNIYLLPLFPFRMHAGSVKDRELSGLLGAMKLPTPGSGRDTKLLSMPLAPKLGDDFRHLKGVGGGSDIRTVGSGATAGTTARRQPAKPPPPSSLLIPSSNGVSASFSPSSNQSVSHGSTPLGTSSLNLTGGTRHGGLAEIVSPASGIASPGMSRYRRV